MDPGRLALAWSVSDARDAGETYAFIGARLGFSKGKAQHLMKELHETRKEAVRALTRPPSRRYRGHQPNLIEVAVSLRKDMQAVEPILALYPDPEGAVDIALSAGDLIYDQESAAIRNAVGSTEDADVTRQLAEIEGAYVRILRLAVDADPALLGEVDASAVLAIFHADALLIAGATDSDYGKLEEAWKETERELRPTESAPPTRHPPLSKEELRSRNDAIVRSRLSGTRIRDIAEEVGLSTKQVSRVIKNFEKNGIGAAAGVYEAVEQAEADIDRQIKVLEARDADRKSNGKKPTARVAIADLVGKKLEIYQRAGLITPDTVKAATGAAADARVDQLASINRAIRSTLGKHGVGLEIVEDVIDEVISASGVPMTAIAGQAGPAATQEQAAGKQA